ncbi:MAG: diguanylate cyclase [Desulfuromonadales bacterium]|nr:diguanylate cyclase [Desulfuromonadales bacterium]
MNTIDMPQNLNILLVEDNEHDRAAFRRAFKDYSAEYRITECVRAPDAISMIEKYPSTFDIVVIDHHLPCMYGLDLCKELLAASIPIPLVILTGSGSEKVAVEALKAGVNDYIIKDPNSAYLEMLPLVLNEVVIAHRERQARQAAELALRESQELLLRIVEGISIPTFVIGTNHVTIYWNRACANITGVPAADVIGTRQQWRAFYDSERPVMADLIVDQVIEETIAQYYSKEYRRSEIIEGAFEVEDFFPHLGETGKWLYFTAAPLKDSNGTIIGAIETLQDVTERRTAELALKESEHRHRELSITDGLTGLYNHRYFFGRIKDEIERFNRYGSQLSMILLDVDNFKSFNDNYGHMNGDLVLAGLADIIRENIRGTDSAYRYGGEEFIVIFPETDPDEAKVVAERLRHSFEMNTYSPSSEITVRTTVSIGGGRYQPDENLATFIKRIDEAMYSAKRRGKNQVVFV